MKKLILNSFASLILLSCLVLPSVRAEVVTLLQDDFAYATTDTATEPIKGTTGGIKTTDGPGYYFLEWVYKAGQCAKIGKTAEVGTLTTHPLTIPSDGILTVSMGAVGDIASSQFEVSVNGGESQVFDPAWIDDDYSTKGWEPFTATFDVTAGTAQVTVKSYSTSTVGTSGTRVVYIDDLLITFEAGGVIEPTYPVTFECTPASPIAAMEMSEVTFTVTAEQNATALTVSALDLPIGATFTDGTVVWTPGLADAGDYEFNFSAVGSEGDTHTTTVTVNVADLALTAPTNVAVSNVVEDGFDVSWDGVTTATEGYVVDVMTIGNPIAGAESGENDETFDDKVLPENWESSHAPLWYSGDAYKFDNSERWLKTMEYANVVTNFSFSLKGYSLRSNASTLVVYGIKDGWETEIARYVDSNGDISESSVTENIALSVKDGYQQFKFEYTKDHYGNVGIDNIRANYLKEEVEVQTAWTGMGTSCTVTDLNPSTVYYVTVGSKDGTQTVYSDAIEVTTAKRTGVFAEIVCTPASPIVVNENQPVNFTLVAVEDGVTNAGAVTFTTALPEGATYDQATGAFAWTPSYTQSGTYELACTTTASDGVTVTDSSVYIAVVDVMPVVTAPTEITVSVLQEVEIAISATLEGEETAVSYASGLPAGASSTFEEGVFKWTPEVADAGAHDIVFNVAGPAGQVYSHVVSVTVESIPLSAPRGLEAVNVSYRTFDVLWDPMFAATNGYIVDVWYGSAAIDSEAGVDAETFFESRQAGWAVAPLGWEFNNIGMYSEDSYVELKFDWESTMITKEYLHPVTNLSFRLQGSSTKTTTDSKFFVYGSDGGTNWTQIAVYSSLSDADGDDSNNIFTLKSNDIYKSIALAEGDGYRRFKFEYQKADGLVKFGQLKAMYEGAGTKMLRGCMGVETSDCDFAVTTATPARTHFVRVGATDGIEIKYTTLRVQTTDAPIEAMLLLR